VNYQVLIPFVIKSIKELKSTTEIHDVNFQKQLFDVYDKLRQFNETNIQTQAKVEQLEEELILFQVRHECLVQDLTEKMQNIQIASPKEKTKLLEMGFEEGKVINALLESNNFDEACSILLNSSTEPNEKPAPGTKQEKISSLKTPTQNRGSKKIINNSDNDDELTSALLTLLTKQSPITTKQLVTALKPEFGNGIRKSDINPILYKLQSEGVVRKIDDAVWALA